MANGVESYHVETSIPIQNVFTGSTKEEETDRGELLGIVDLPEHPRLFKVAIPTPYGSLLALFHVDDSSVYPHFEARTETSLIKEAPRELTPEDILEFNIVVRMPPVREYTVHARIRSVERATPRIVKPEEF